MDVTKLAGEVFVMVQAYVARAVEPLLARLQAIEDRPLPEAIKGDPGEPGGPGEPGKDGTSVTLEQVQPLLDQAVDKWALDFERRAQGLLERAIDRMPKPTDGKDGENGVDGIGFDDLSVEHDGGREITLRFQKGDQVKSFVITLPVVLDAGYWKAGNTFQPGDGVTDGGSYWIAQKETTTRPEVGNEDWRLAVRKGRDSRGVELPKREPQPVKLSAAE